MNRNHGVLVGVMAGVAMLVFQAAAAGQVRLGAHGGLSIPNIRGSEDDPFSQGFTSRQGPFFGVFAEFGLAPHWSLVAELNYTSQGGKRNGLQRIDPVPPELQALLPPDTPVFANFKNDTVLDYIELPVLGRFTFGNRMRFFLNVGPYVGYLVRARAITAGSSLIFLDAAGTIPITPEPVSLDADTDVMDSLKRWNAGLYGGGGFRYGVGPGEFILEAHFQLGLARIQKDVATSGDSQTGAVVVSLGYAFPLWK